MANIYKVLGQVAPAANTATTLYTVPAGRSAIVSSINVCNPSTTTTTDIRIAVVPSGNTLSTQHYITYGLPVPFSDSINVAIGITLAANDSIVGYANNTASMAFSVFGLEIS